MVMKWGFGAGAILVNGAGDEFLSRAAFTGDHHAAGLGGDRFDQVEEFAHLRARADNVVEAGELAKTAAQIARLFFQGLRFGVLFHCGTKFIEQPIAFNDVAVGAEVHGVNGGVDGWHASDENECCRRRHLFAVAQKLQAVHIGHADIGNHDVENSCRQVAAWRLRHWRQARLYARPYGN